MDNDRRQKITRYCLGFAAWALALYFLVARGGEPVVFFASAFFLVICVTDTLQSKIPNLATLTLLLVGLGYHLTTRGLPGAGLSLAGLLTGLGLLLVPYLLGGMGAGDLKALAALGALLGPVDVFQVFLLSGLVGGGMALLHLALSDRPLALVGAWRAKIARLAGGVAPAGAESQEAPARIKYSYGPAIAFGFFAFIRWGGLV